MLKVKICGITNRPDAVAAAALGVDALGFIFAKSPRRIEPEKAQTIIRALPPFITTVGVFVNEDPEDIRRIVAFCGLDMIQFHGDESPEVCEAFMPRAIKAFQLRDESGLSQIHAYAGKVRAVVFDTYSKDKRGGTGRSFDWTLAVKGKQGGIPVILSGGLGPANIAEAVSTVQPSAVDVNSGVEKKPGVKDHHLMKTFMAIVRNGS